MRVHSSSRTKNKKCVFILQSKNKKCEVWMNTYKYPTVTLDIEVHKATRDHGYANVIIFEKVS